MFLRTLFLCPGFLRSEAVSPRTPPQQRGTAGGKPDVNWLKYTLHCGQRIQTFELLVDCIPTSDGDPCRPPESTEKVIGILDCAVTVACAARETTPARPAAVIVAAADSA